MLAITIRQATIADVAGVLECLHAAFEPYQMAYTAAAYEDTVLTRESLLRRLAKMTVMIAVDRSGRVIGTIAYEVSGEGEGHLRGMAVLPETQGHGVADRLVDRVEAELMKENCSRISLDTTVPLDRAICFYERRGYRRSGRTQDFFGMTLIEYLKLLKHEP